MDLSFQTFSPVCVCSRTWTSACLCLLTSGSQTATWRSCSSAAHPLTSRSADAPAGHRWSVQHRPSSTWLSVEPRSPRQPPLPTVRHLKPVQWHARSRNSSWASVPPCQYNPSTIGKSVPHQQNFWFDQKCCCFFLGLSWLFCFELLQRQRSTLWCRSSQNINSSDGEN